MDGVLELVSQHAEVLPAAGPQPVAVHDNHFALVAVRVRGAGVGIAGGEVARGGYDGSVQHGEARVSVDAGLPDVADDIDYRRSNLPLEDICRLFEFLRGQVGLHIGVPVGVLADGEQLRLHRIGAPLYEVGNEEGLAMPRFAAAGAGRQRAREGRIAGVRSAVSLREGE